MNRVFMMKGKVSCNKLVGVITDAYHMKGMVKIKTFTSKPENICHLKCQYENDDHIIIEKGSVPNVFRIKGVENRTEAEKIIGNKIYVKKEDLPEIEAEDEFYMDDMPGMPVLDSAGAKIGIVMGCFNFGAGDILEVSFIDGREEMYLFTHENFPEVTKEFVRIASVLIN
jgi:16S rRNA processing protein RimM